MNVKRGTYRLGLVALCAWELWCVWLALGALIAWRHFNDAFAAHSLTVAQVLDEPTLAQRLWPIAAMMAMGLAVWAAGCWITRGFNSN